MAQAGVKGLKAAAAKGIPVVIMEPLRGGKLVNMLPAGALEAMKKSGHDWNPAEWGLRWLYNQKEVTVVLSGMNSLEMVEENCRTASEAAAGHLTEADFETLEVVKSCIREKEKVGCTGCRYCMPCPSGVDIPANFHYWNLMYIEGKKTPVRFEFARNVGMQKQTGFANQCVGCGKCESHCPQHIQIRDMLKKADKELRPLPYKVLLPVVRKVMSR